LQKRRHSSRCVTSTPADDPIAGKKKGKTGRCLRREKVIERTAPFSWNRARKETARTSVVQKEPRGDEEEGGSGELQLFEGNRKFAGSKGKRPIQQHVPRETI